MKKTTLKILDQVNCKFEGLDPFTRRKVSEALKFFVPYARHMPAFKLGRWDGKVGFATVGGGTYVNLLDRVLPIIMEEGYDIELDDQRPSYNFEWPEISEDMFAKQGKVWPEGHPVAGQPVMLRDYQVEAIQKYIDNLQSIQVVSTGGGKTLTTAALSFLVEPYGRSLIIVPSKTLVEQTADDYRNLGLDVGVYYGDKKEWGHQHTIATWQSMAVFTKKERRGELESLGITFADFIDGLICVMVDECHTSKSTEVKELLCGPLAHVPIRFGLTGTLPKEEHDALTLLAAIGPAVGETRAKELQDKGVLANCHVTIKQLNDSHVEYKSYPEESNYLTSDRARLDWIAEFAQSLDGNTLLLIDKIDTGEYLTSIIPDSSFISGKMKTKDRREEFKEIHTSYGKLIVATYGTMSTGVNVPKIHNLILVECGKSFVRVIQSAGRVLRMAEGKDFANIYDICSTLKFSKGHLNKRKNFYSEAEYPYSIEKINYR